MTTEIVAAAQLHPRADEDPQPADRRQAHRRRVRGRQAGAGDHRRAGLGHAGARRTSCGRSATSWRPSSARTRPMTATRSTRAATGSRRRSTGTCRRSSSATSTPPPGRRTPRTRARSSSRARSRAGTGTGSSACAAATSTTRRPRSSTTGPATCWPTSVGARYTSKGNKKFQPQFDVLSDGWRQPGSSIKPIDYVIGIEDKAYTAGHDVHGRDDDLRRRVHADPGRQAGARPGPPAQRAPVLAQHPGHQGDDHQRPRAHVRAHPGLRPDATRAPPSRSSRWASARSRPTRSTCSAPTARSPTAACACRARRSPRSSTRTASQVWPIGDDARPRASRSSARRPPTSSPTSWPATPTREVNPYWGEWAVYDGRQAPPGRLQDGHDERQRRRPCLRLPAPRPRTRTRRPSPSASGWATATTTPTSGSLSLDSSAPLWSAIMTAVSKDMPIAKFKAPGWPQVGDRRRVHRSATRPVHDARRSRSCSCPGTVPSERETSRVGLEIDEASGLLWRRRLRRTEGDQGLLRPHRGREQLAGLAEGQPQLGGPGGQGARAPAGTSKGTRTAYFYTNGVRAVRSLVGRAVRARQELSAGAAAVRCPGRPIRTRRTTSRHRRRSPAPPRRPIPVAAMAAATAAATVAAAAATTRSRPKPPKP